MLQNKLRETISEKNMKLCTSGGGRKKQHRNVFQLGHLSLSLQPQLLCRFLHERDFDANESIKSDTLCSVFIREHCATEGRVKATLHSCYQKTKQTKKTKIDIQTEERDTIKEGVDRGRKAAERWRKRLKAWVWVSGVVDAHQKKGWGCRDTGQVRTVCSLYCT